MNPEQPANESNPNVRCTYITGRTFGQKKVFYTDVSGEARFEGDIVLGTTDQMEQIRAEIESADPSVERACAIVNEQQLWPNATVPFRIDAALPNQQRVANAINHLQNSTNLRFVQRTTEADFVTFRDGNGCSSSVGRRGGEQFVTMGSGCDWPRVVHEICHAIGLWHEQSREDRDAFVSIHWDNIASGTEHNFNQHITDGDDVGCYDYGSLMHYGRRDFAVDNTKDTITPTDTAATIGQRTGLSSGDIAAIGRLYQGKSVLGETSSNGPALATSGTSLLLSWTGTGNLRLSFLQSTDGRTFTNKVVLGDTSPAAPALAFFSGKWFIAWIGVGNNRLNVMCSGDGISWGGKVTLGDISQSSPTLAVFGGQLYLSWRGVGNNNLNVMQTVDGVNWVDKVVLPETTTSGPALIAFGARLLLAWRGDGNNYLNVMGSPNGTDFSGKSTLSETTTSRPSLHVRDGEVFLCWQGVGNRMLNVLASADGTSWARKYTSHETCIDGPVTSDLGGRLIWCWTGTDDAHHLNSLTLNVV
jgi:hypothetical protein